MKTFNQFLSEAQEMHINANLSEEQIILDEDLISKFDKWIEKTLDKLTGSGYSYPYLVHKHLQAVDDAIAKSPKEPYPKELMDKFWADQKMKAEMERLAWENKTTVEKIKPIFNKFAEAFVGKALRKWRGMTSDQKRELVVNIFKGLLNLFIFILEALAKRR